MHTRHINDMTSNKIISSIIGTIIIIILLVTNPEEYQLKEYIKHNLKSKAVEEGGLGGAIKELVAGPQSWLMTFDTKRTNVYLFSLYNVSGLDTKKRYIGMFNTFIELPFK